MEIVHILTVGTSLLENNGGNGRTSRQSFNEIRQLKEECQQTKDLAWTHDLANLLTMKKVSVYDALNSLNPEIELSFRPPSRPDGPTDRLPQEVSYLWLHTRKRGENEPKAKCYLLASDTKLGQFCAAVIEQYVNTHSQLANYYRVENWERVNGVDALNAQAFQERGFRNLLDKVDAIIREHLSASRIYLNLTGGFKGLLPYGTVQGMLYASGQLLRQKGTEFVLCYLFEETPEIIEMRSYPIGVNFHHWHRNAARLRMVRKGAKSFRNNLSEQMTNLLPEETEEFFSLGRYLEEEYQKQVEEDPLKVYSKEIVSILLKDAPATADTEPQRLQQVLNELIDKKGDLLWIGDKIPDMVDHALKHHQHLLEFAELFLTPILAQGRGFMNAKERFCLIAGILLHDCGHSLDYLKSATMAGDGDEILLFPSDVRDYHHFLTYQRLDDPRTAGELSWPGREGFKNEGLDEKLHDAVRLVCLYHRRRAGYDKYCSEEEKEKAKNHLTNEELYPLLERCEINALLECGIDLMKVVAFMRLVDGCDVQSRRVGSPQFVEQKMKVLERDYHTAIKRAKEAFELYGSLAQEIGTCEKIARLTDAIQIGEAGVCRLDDGKRIARSACRELLRNGGSREKNLARLWQIAAELVDRANMKLKQRFHYLKHQCVKEVLVFPRSDSSGKRMLAFDVVLYPEPNLGDKLTAEIEIDGNQKKMQEWIQEEISSEYGSVMHYAVDKYGLQIYYWWNNEYEKLRGGRPFFSPSS